MQQQTLLCDDIFQIKLLKVDFRAWNGNKGKDRPEFFELLVKLLHKCDIVALSEAFAPALPSYCYCFLIIFRNSRIKQIGSDKQGCSAHSSMAVNQYFASLINHKVNYLGYAEDFFE